MNILTRRAGVRVEEKKWQMRFQEMKKENAALNLKIEEMSKKIDWLRRQAKDGSDLLDEHKIRERQDLLESQIVGCLKSGPKSISEITRKTSQYGAGERREVLFQMVESGRITKERKRPKGRGATATVYTLTEAIAEDPFSVRVSFSVGEDWKTAEEIESTMRLTETVEDRLKQLFSDGKIDFKDRATASGKKRMYRICRDDA